MKKQPKEVWVETVEGLRVAFVFPDGERTRYRLAVDVEAKLAALSASLAASEARAEKAEAERLLLARGLRAERHWHECPLSAMSCAACREYDRDGLFSFAARITEEAKNG